MCVCLQGNGSDFPLTRASTALKVLSLELFYESSLLLNSATVIMIMILMSVIPPEFGRPLPRHSNSYTFLAVSLLFQNLDFTHVSGQKANSVKGCLKD